MTAANTIHLLNPCLTTLGWSKGKLIGYQELYSELHNVGHNVLTMLPSTLYFNTDQNLAE